MTWDTDAVSKWGPPLRTGLTGLCTMLLVWLVFTVHAMEVRQANIDEQIAGLRRDLDQRVGAPLSALEARIIRLENIALKEQSAR